MFRWDIVLTPFPFSDLSGQKVRPALVLFVDEKQGDMVVAFLTSKVRRTGEYDVSVLKSEENGLRADSILCLSKLSTLDTRCAIGRIGTIEDQYRKKIHQNLHQIFGMIDPE